MNHRHSEVDMKVTGVMKEDIMTDKDPNTHSQRDMEVTGVMK